MDLRAYLESELVEEKELGYAVSGVAASGSANGYPGDSDVYVADTDIAVARMELTGSGVDQAAYVARPSGGGRAPAVLVIHENKGLVPYIENVARRLARHGYVACAPDLLARVGGTGSFEDPSEVTAALGGIDGDDLVADLRGVLEQLADLDYVVSERLGVIGFCYGGGIAWRLLTKEPRLSVGVPFYGPNPDLDAVPGIQAAVLAVYGELDERITSQLPEIQKAMTLHGKTFESLVIDGAQHAFHNDSNPDRYNAAAAREAWDTALGWLDRWLVAP